MFVLATGESSCSEVLHGGNGKDVESEFESDIEEIEFENEKLSDDFGEMETETETSDTETDEDTNVPSQRQGKYCLIHNYSNHNCNNIIYYLSQYLKILVHMYFI